MHLLGPLMPGVFFSVCVFKSFVLSVGHLLRCQLHPLYLQHIWSETCIKSDLIKQSCGLSGRGSASLRVCRGF